MPLCALLSQLQPQHAFWIGSFLYLKCFSSFPVDGLSSPFPPLPGLLLLIFQISVQIIITSKAANVLIKFNHLILLFLFFLNFSLWNNYWPAGMYSLQKSWSPMYSSSSFPEWCHIVTTGQNQTEDTDIATILLPNYSNCLRTNFFFYTIMDTIPIRSSPLFCRMGKARSQVL